MRARYSNSRAFTVKAGSTLYIIHILRLGCRRRSEESDDFWEKLGDWRPGDGRGPRFSWILGHGGTCGRMRTGHN